MLYREIIAVCSQIHTKLTNTLCGQNVELYIKTQYGATYRILQGVLYSQNVIRFYGARINVI